MIKIEGYKEVKKGWLSNEINSRIAASSTSKEEIAHSLGVSAQTVYNSISTDYVKHSTLINVAKCVDLQLLIINTDEGKKYFVK